MDVDTQNNRPVQLFVPAQNNHAYMHVDIPEGSRPAILRRPRPRHPLFEPYHRPEAPQEQELQRTRSDHGGINSAIVAALRRFSPS